MSCRPVLKRQDELFAAMGERKKEEKVNYMYVVFCLYACVRGEVSVWVCGILVCKCAGVWVMMS